MSQPANWGLQTSGPASPDAVAGRGNDSLNALLSMHKGSSAPAYRMAGTRWLDDSAAIWAEKVYDGTQWITVATFDPTTHLWKPAGVTDFARGLLDDADAAAGRTTLGAARKAGYRLANSGVYSMTPSGATSGTTGYGVAATTDTLNLAATVDDAFALVLFNGLVDASLGTNTGADVGFQMILKYFTGSAYQAVGPAAQGLLLNSATAAGTILRQSFNIAMLFNASHFRSDVPRTWAIKPYFNAIYSGNTAELLAPVMNWMIFEGMD